MYQEYLNQLHTAIAQHSSEELKELLNDDDKLNEKVEQVLNPLKQQKDNLLMENRLKAESNIEKEPKIVDLRGKISELLEQGKQYCSSIQEILSEIKEKEKGISQDSALALLQTSAAENEEESEDLVKKFTENEINVEAFLDDFLTARKSMHLRKFKAEKMQDIMRQPQRNSINIGGGGQPAYSNIPSTGFFSQPQAPMNYGAGGLPYPTGPMMPMPPSRPY